MRLEFWLRHDLELSWKIFEELKLDLENFSPKEEREEKFGLRIILST